MAPSREARRQKEARSKVAALLNPRNVVVAGASDRPGSWSQRVWRNLHRYGFDGPVWPLNPSRETIWGTRCHPDFDALPGPPDHVVIVVPARHVASTLRAASKAGARSATVITSGFGEVADPDAQALAAELRTAIADSGLAVSGPNCLGNISGPAHFMTMPDDRPQRVETGPVALVGQSGGLVMAIKRTLEERGTDTGYVVTSGNEAGLTTADYIDFFAADPTVRVIVSYLEAVRDPAAFLAACRAARAAGKPVVAAKLGASDEGRAAALAHTGALAGAMDAFDAVAGDAGLIRVETLDEIIEAVEYLLHARLPAGAGLGGITFSGGLRGLLLDRAHANGLRFPPLAPVTRRHLETLLGVGTIIGNPLDSGFTALTSQDAYLGCVDALLKDPGIDLLLLQEEIPRGPGAERKESNLRAVNALAADANKPIAFVTMISHGMNDYARALRAELPHLAFLQEPDKAMRTLRAITDHAARRRRSRTKPPPVSGNARARLGRLLARHPPCAGRMALSEADSKALLRACGLRVPRERIARSAAEAARHARAIGFPIVLKALSAALTHKSDAGGVVVGLTSASAVREAYRAIERNVARRANGLRIDGVIVAQQVSGGLELALGAVNDPEVGPVIMAGSGGVALELHKDVAFAAAPLDEPGATALIARTRAARLIDGWRGAPALDRGAAVKALLAVSALAVALGDRLDSIDVNPFVLRRRGGMALDALVVLAGDGGGTGDA